MARTKGKFVAFFRKAGASSALALARGTAVFIGVYSLASSAAGLRSTHASQNLWWIDLRFMPSTVGLAIGIACPVVLLAYAVAPCMAPWRRLLSVATSLVLAAVALQNVSAFYRAWGQGSVHPGVVFPLSLVIAVVFVLLAWAMLAMRPSRQGVAGHIGAGVAFLVVLALFPLAQIAFFGTSDYRAKADAAVVFGARVFDNGALSPSLRDRVVTGVDLYRAGLVRILVMSGGLEANGIDETVAMRDGAVRAGVPSSAVVLDAKGFDTDATVRDTSAIFVKRGMHRVLAVSQGYHLPRVKLAYLSAGWDVRTVPAKELEPIWSTPLFVAREVPAFWEYWLRAFMRDVQGR